MKNQIKKVLSIVLVVVMCLSTFAIAASAEEACAHANAQLVEHKDASCGQFGYDAYKCPDCNKEYVLNIEEPLEHDYDEVENVPGNCVTKDKVVEKCANCGHERFVDGKDGTATGNTHTLGELQYKEVNGELKGYKVCSVCNAEVPEEFDHNHDAEGMEIVLSTLVKPTCTQKGKVTYKCKVAGCPYTTEVTIEKTHQIKLVPASTESCEGNAAYYTCTLCNKNFSDAAGTTEITEIPQKDHTISAGAAYTVKVANNCTKGTLEVRVYKCEVCGEDVEVTAEEVTHNWGTVQTVAATCTKWGYTYKQCKDCGDIEQAQKLAPHHSFEVVDANNNKTIDPSVTPTKVAITCGDTAYLVYVCTNADCDAGHKIAATAGACPVDGCNRIHAADNEIWIVDTSVNEGQVRNHNYSVKVSDGSPATCTVNGTKAHYKCEYCGAADPDRDGSPITAAHTFAATTSICTVAAKEYNYCTTCEKYILKGDVTVAAGAAESHIIVTEIIQEATCNKPGKKATYCIACGDRDSETVEIEATGCKYADEPTLTLPATCSTPAMMIYECINENCDANGVHKVVYGTTYDKTAAGHELHMTNNGKDLSALVGEELRKATCTVKGLYKYTCTCGESYTKQTADGVYGDHVVVDKEEVLPDCKAGTTGKAAGKYCTTCEKWISGGETLTHTADATFEGSNDVCGKDGWKEFKYCSICAEKYEVEGAPNSYIEALKSADGTKIAGHVTNNTTAAADPATCLKPGRVAVTYCTVCYDTQEKVDALLAKSEYATEQLTHAIGGADIKVDNTKANATCTADGYVLNYCEVCSYAVINNFKYVLGHDWSETESKHNFTCTEDGYSYYACENGCGAENKIAGSEVAAGHVTNTDPEAEDYKKFTSSCEDIDETTHCAVCNQDITVTHDFNAELTKVDASCFENGYTIKVCANCTETDVTILPQVGHHSVYLPEGKEDKPENWVIPTGSVKVTAKCVPATHTSTGKDVYECALCDAEIEVTLPKLTTVDLIIDADSAISEGAVLVNGGKVTFTVKIKANNLTASSIFAEFEYNKNALKFIESESSIANIFDIEGKITTQSAFGNNTDGTEGKVMIYADASNDAAGNIGEKDLSGNEILFATLTFEINKGFYANIKNNQFVETSIDGNIEVFALDDEETAVITATATAEPKTVKVYTLGSLNGDEKIDAVDLMRIRDIINAKKYDACADFDFDGDVDVADYVVLRQFYVSGKHYNDFFNPAA